MGYTWLGRPAFAYWGLQLSGVGRYVLFVSLSLFWICGLSRCPGASDGNSRKAPILPWLRSIDGLNTHDESYQLAMAGGVTTAQILPGSANNIGMCAIFAVSFILGLIHCLQEDRRSSSNFVPLKNVLLHPRSSSPLYLLHTHQMGRIIFDGGT